MTKTQGWARACLLGFLGWIVLVPAWSQSGTVTPEDEYKKLIQVSEDIQPLGENPFGEDISLYSGSLSFQQTDVSLAGNGPLLQFNRTFEMVGKDGRLGRPGQAFGDWDLSLPRITTLSAFQQNVHGWVVGTADNTDRCTYFTKPPSVAAPPGDAARADWEPETWWQGYQLIVPGHGSQELVPRASANSLSPQMSGKTFNIVTTQNWMINCLPATANGQPGEAFFAVAPDGTKYWFDELVYRWAPTLRRPLWGGPITQTIKLRPEFMVASNADILPSTLRQVLAALPALPVDDSLVRREASMLVTRVEDRFGNYLTYSYDSGGRLTAITASDGRQLTVQRVSGSNLVSMVKLQPASGSPRKWMYGYTGTNEYDTRLTTVTLPDGTHWSFDLSDFSEDAWLHSEMQGSCSNPGEPDYINSTWTGSITHPSGLVGIFSVHPAKHGRSYVPRQCWGGQLPTHEDGYALVPRAWYSFTVTQKTFSGAGVPTETWNYSYSSPNESWAPDCSGGCTSTVWTEVEAPDQRRTRYTFSNKYDVSEGKLKRVDYYSGGAGSAVVRSEVNTYADATSGSWPAAFGYNLQPRKNGAQATQLSPLSKRVLTQDGNTYTWQAQAFNAYAQVTQTQRSNNIAGQALVEERTGYFNDTLHWVLGLPLQSDNLTTGVTVDRYVYDTDNATLQGRYHFCTNLLSDPDPAHDNFTTCHKVMDYTFYGASAGNDDAGQLSSFTDGRGKTTTLGNYERGIPQAIGYPDGTSQSLSVDDFGQIASITDPAGKTTSYSYDAVGRLTGITYPADSVAWYPKSFAYAYVTGAERGLGGGHWRRTVSTGNARQVTYFDALLRPVLSDTYISGDSASHSNARTGYNWKGQTVLQSWPEGGTPSLTALTDGTHTTYDALGRVTQVTQDSELGSLTTTTAYLSGARQQVTDPKGHVTTTTYQVFDQPGYDAVIKVQAPEALTQTITRNLYGHPTAITQSGTYGTESVSVTKTLVYDAYQRLCRTTEPESGSTVMDYDAADNLAWSATGLAVTGTGCGREQVTAGAKVSRTYDAMNRVLTVDYPVGTEDTVFTYDARGNVQTAASGLTAWTYTRNARGLLTDETLAIDGYSWPLSYPYDRYGTVATVTYPDGKPVAYAPDALGRASKAGAYVTSVGYLPDGDIEYFMLGNGTEYLAEKNARHLLSSLNYEHGSLAKVSQDLTYDKNANLTKVDDQIDGQRDKVLSYDALNRLTQAKAVNLWGTETYSYDPLNNIRSLNSDGLSRTYHYNPSTWRLDTILSGSATLHSFVHDDRGNAVQKDSQVRVFDEANRLTQVVGTESYAYDAAGRRVKKTPAGGTPVYYAYNSAGRLMWEYVPATTTTGTGSDYVYLGSKLVAKLDRPTSTLAPAAPASITVPATSDASLTVQWAASSYAVTYRLQQQKDAGSWTTVYDGEGVSKALTLAASGAYVYRVAACNGAGCSGYTTSSPVAVTLPPDAAPTLTVPSGTSTTGDYTVSWSAVSGAATYVLQEQKNSGSWSEIHNSSSRSQALSGKATGTWGYRVRAHNAGGDGPWSTTKTVTVLLPPAVPASLTVPATSSGSVATSWSSAATATSYTLQHRKGTGSWSQAYNGSATSKTVTETSTGSYTYRVQACNASGCSSWRTSSAVAVTIPPATAPSLTVPSTSSTGGYTVSWTAVSGASTYALEEKKNSGSWSNAYSGSSRSKAFSGKTNGADYSYRVRAHNAGGDGPWSATKTVAIAIPPPVPGGLTLSTTGPDYKPVVHVAWSAVSGATEYRVEETHPVDGVMTFYIGPNTSANQLIFASGTVKFRVRACNAVACSGWSGYKTIILHSGIGDPIETGMEPTAAELESTEDQP